MEITEEQIKSWIRDEIKLAEASENIYIHSPDGTLWEITIDDLGVLTQTEITL